MKAITFQGVEAVAFGDVEDPGAPGAGEAVVAVEVAGVCGSDLHPYFGRERGLDSGTVMGHEFLGRVVDVGAGVTGIAVGDRVVAPFTTSCGECFYCLRELSARCVQGQLFGWVQDGRGLQGAQAERVRVPLAETTLVKAPSALDPAVALLAGDVLATALFASDLAAVGTGDRVVVVGCGPVGLLAIRAALARGAVDVMALDRVPSRLRLAAEFGASVVDVDGDEPVRRVRERTDGFGADAAIDAVGSPDATRMAADVLRAGGRLAAVGVHTEPHLALSPGDLYDRNLRYAAGRCPARTYLPEALALAAREERLLAGLVSHRLPLSEGVEAYRMFAERRDGCSKVVLLP